MNLLLVENQSAQEFRVKGGSQRISQKLVSKIGPHRVLLKHAATKIDQTVVLMWDSKIALDFQKITKISQRISKCLQI